MEVSEERYRTLCSLETLRSGKKGFFRDFGEHACRTVGERWIAKVFGRLTTDEDRIRTIFTDRKAKDAVFETLDRTDILYRGKDAAASRARRLEAYSVATAGQRPRALLLSSQAVLRAPLPGARSVSEESKDNDRGLGLPLALLARAEILLASNEPALALEDLSAVDPMTPHLPQQLKTELSRRREEARRGLLSSKQSVERKDASPPKVSGGENAALPGASALVEIADTVNAGKQAIARNAIAPGDSLVIESPLAAVLLPEFFGTHCHHCFARFKAPVGCPDCSSVAFCGRACRDTAMAGYHGYECKILALLIGSGMSVLSMLALRMVTGNGPDKCSRIWRALKERRLARAARLGESVAEPSKSARRRRRKKRNKQQQEGKDSIDLRAYDLVTHENKRSAEDFFQRSLMAAFLLKCLQRVGFFASRATDGEGFSSRVASEEEIAVGALLLKHLQLLQFNAHEVFETRLGRVHRFRGSKPVYIGVAIYPTVARFNHDCYPAVARHFAGQRIVIRATRSLAPGDVVAENYGPIFTKRTLEERRTTLGGRYWFRCECTACRENWPRFENLSNDRVRLRCPTEGCRRLHRFDETIEECGSCNARIDLAASRETLAECEGLYARGFAAMEEERSQEALSALLEGMKKFHRVAVPPHKDTHLAEIAASSCMADEGNVWRVDDSLLVQP